MWGICWSQAADFYGPEVTNSALGEHVFAKIRDDSAPAGMLLQNIRLSAYAGGV